MKIADRYEPTGNAHWGGMSEVHECLDHHLGRLVMLKRMKSKADFSRLLDEKKSLMTLRSKHVVELMDVVEYDYAGDLENGLILEKIEGKDREENSLDPNAGFVRVLYQIASGLSDIHDAGVIHRDIKPPNLRMDEAGTIKILDFGLSRQTGKDNKTKSIAGTHGFMAPELFGTKTISFTSAIDVFAFGVTASALLKYDPTKTVKIPDVSASKLKELHPGLDDELAQVVCTCLSANPAGRPKMKDVRDTLARRILRSKHRAQVVFDKSYELDATKNAIKVNGANGSIEIIYTGTDFVVKNVTGAVYVNNSPISAGFIMLNACVITLGRQDQPSRAFLTFDISQPEV